MTDQNKMSCLFLGFGLGTAVGMFLEQKAGSKTRNEIRRRMREGKEHLEQQRRELLDSATETVSRGKQVVHNQMKSLSDAIAAGKLAYKRSVRADSNSCA